jgi:hypothetical protein
VHYRLKGAIGFNRQCDSYTGQCWWNNQQLLNPVITAYIYLCYYNAALDRVCINDTTDSFTMSQFWQGWGCNYYPNLAFNIPWGVSFGGWMNCGNRNIATDPSPQEAPIVYGHNSWYQQANTGNNAHLPNYHNDPLMGDTSLPCYGVYVGGWFGEGDNKSTEFGSITKQVCEPA